MANGDSKGNILTDAVKAIPAVISGVAGLFSNSSNRKEQRKENERNREFSWDMYRQTVADNRENWWVANEYNLPSNQMQRLKDAGLNPNLVYGHGADAQSKGVSQSGTTHNPNTTAPRWELGSLAQNALMTQQVLANISKTQAETEAIRSNTVGTDFDNAVKKKIGLDMYQLKFNTEYNKLSTQQKKELTEYELWLDSSGVRGSMAETGTAVGSLAYKAQKAGFELAVQELQNAKNRGDVLAAEKTIKNFEANLTKQGMSPNSPWYLKTLMSLGEKAGLDMNSLTK